MADHTTRRLSEKTAEELELRGAREALICELRSKHVAWRKIAAQVGLSHARCVQIYEEVRDRIPAQRLHDIRMESWELIDDAINNLLEIARDTKVSANARVLAWTEIRQQNESLRKLFGADAPSRKEVTVLTDGVVDAEIRKLNEELAQQDQRLAEIDALEVEAVSSLRDLGEDVKGWGRVGR